MNAVHRMFGGPDPIFLSESQISSRFSQTVNSYSGKIALYEFIKLLYYMTVYHSSKPMITIRVCSCI